jgi:hypothetical protein
MKKEKQELKQWKIMKTNEKTMTYNEKQWNEQWKTNET